jgi:hypothetical protein
LEKKKLTTQHPIRLVIFPPSPNTSKTTTSTTQQSTTANHPLLAGLGSFQCPAIFTARTLDLSKTPPLTTNSGFSFCNTGTARKNSLYRSEVDCCIFFWFFLLTTHNPPLYTNTPTTNNNLHQSTTYTTKKPHSKHSSSPLFFGLGQFWKSKKIFSEKKL